MKYNEIELKEFYSDKPILFDPPKKMLVWDHERSGEEMPNPKEDCVLAFIPGRICPVIAANFSYWHCAEIPEQPKSRRATNRELAMWLAKGNGECKVAESAGGCHSFFNYVEQVQDDEAICVSVRKWDDTKWHEPTVDYMFGKE